jgi:hypothetical protein
MVRKRYDAREIGTALKEGSDIMAKRRTKAPRRKTDAENSPPPAHTPNVPAEKKRRRNPPWHRQYLRRLAIHGNKSRAAREVEIDYRHAQRLERAKPRFRRAVLAALRIAERRYAEAIERDAEDMALNGIEQRVYQGGQLVGSFQRYFPALTRHVLDTVSPKYRARADAKLKAHQHAQGSVSNIGTLNVSLSQVSTDNPNVRALLLALSDELTRSRADSPVLDVTPPSEAPAASSDEASIVVRSDDE